MLGAQCSELGSFFLLMVAGLIIFRVADKITTMLAVMLLFLLKVAELVLLAIAIGFVTWSLYEIFK